MKQAIQSIISNNLLPDLDLLRDRDRRGGGLRDRLGERDRDRPTKIQNKCLLQYYGKKLTASSFPIITDNKLQGNCSAIYIAAIKFINSSFCILNHN